MQSEGVNLSVFVSVFLGVLLVAFCIVLWVVVHWAESARKMMHSSNEEGRMQLGDIGQAMVSTVEIQQRHLNEAYNRHWILISLLVARDGASKKMMDMLPGVPMPATRQRARPPQTPQEEARRVQIENFRRGMGSDGTTEAGKRDS